MGTYWNFDILHHVTDASQPKRPESYRTINVMCYLMYGLSYNEYFNGQVKTQVLPHFIKRLRHDNYAIKPFFKHPITGNVFKQYPEELAQTLETIVADANVPPDLVMRELYEADRSTTGRDAPEKYPPADHQRAKHLWEHFAKLRANDRRRVGGPIFSHLCLPFLLQMYGIQPSVIDVFLNGSEDASVPVIRRYHGLGKFSLIDLYRNSKRDLAWNLLQDMLAEARATVPDTPDSAFLNDDMAKYMSVRIHKMITIGQSTALLIFHSPQRVLELKALLKTWAGLQDSLMLMDSKANDQCCVNRDCRGNYPDKFCSKTLTNDCSAASDDCAPDTEDKECPPDTDCPPDKEEKEKDCGCQ